MSIYLDYNATAPARPEVLAVMQELHGAALNASSVHASGRKAKQILEASRKTIAETINCFTNEIIFVGTGSEANNWALSGYDNVLVSAVEHASILKPHQVRHPREGGDPRLIPVDSAGVVNLIELDARLHSEKTKLVSVILANNETGVIQPIKDIAEIVHKHGALLHTDAVQALGKIPLDFSYLGVDMMTISAHKMGGAVGAAALVVRNNLPISPFIKGGGQELNRRAGTENIPAIAGFAEAVKSISLSHMQQLRKWLDLAENEMKNVSRETFLVGAESPRLPNTLCVTMPSVPSETQLMAFDLDKIEVSAGSACSSGRIESSHVLKAMGIAPDVASCAIRVSGGWNTTEEDIKSFVKSWKNLYERLSLKRAC
jgi:cysteine desulfurase